MYFLSETQVIQYINDNPDYAKIVLNYVISTNVVIRGMYKDLVKFLQKDEYLEDYQLKNKVIFFNF